MASKTNYNIFRSKIIEEYIEKYSHYGNRTIARILFADHPDHFLDVEAARRMIRYRKGASGDAERQSIKNPKYAKSF